MAKLDDTCVRVYLHPWEGWPMLVDMERNESISHFCLLSSKSKGLVQIVCR